MVEEAKSPKRTDVIELFVCYHCKADDCANCVGVPCMCDCPDPKTAGEEKCCFKDCERRGKPQAGFDFFACEPCLYELGRLIEQKYAEAGRKKL